MNDNYIKLSEEYLDNVDSYAVLYSHKQTKARVVTIKCDDPNKAFCITFKTAPTSSKGIPHILEHSVLSGSKKYPLKDPFNVLMKTSVNTFLNAFTESDRTSFPVASCNLKDFKNLTDVYLDAVFNPLIYDKEEIFLTEGWHYEIENKDEPIKINGVVYNEMKGTSSETSFLISNKIKEALFPNTCYAFESGGDPKEIPNLSRSEFLEFHKNHYHPSNSLIFLYGDLDMEERLDYLDKEYLSKYEYLKPLEAKLFENEFKETKFIESEYHVSNSQEVENEYIYSLNIAFNERLNPLDDLAMVILLTYLFKTEKSKVKRRMASEDITVNFTTSYSNDLKQPYVSLIALSAKKNKLNDFLNIINEELNNIVSNGINKEEIKSIIDFLEFDDREDNRGTNKGIEYFLDIMPGLVYEDEDPFVSLKSLKYYDILRNKLDTDYYINLINKYLVNNNHKAVVSLVPTFKKEENREEIKLSEFKSKLTDKELDDLINKTYNLKEYQDQEDSKEDLDKLPKLTLLDIEENPVKYNLEETLDNVYLSEYFTKDIIYKKYFYKISNVSRDTLQYIKLLEMLIGDIDTKNSSFETIEQELLKSTGDINFKFKLITKKNREFDLYFVCEFSYLASKSAKANKIVEEILFDSVFTNTNRIKELIVKQYNRKKKNIVSSANTYARVRVLSYSSKAYSIDEDIRGINFYYFLKDIVKNFDDNKENIISKLETIFNKIFKSNALIHLTCSKENYMLEESAILNFKNKLGNPCDFNESYDFKPNFLNEAFIIPSNVNFIACGKEINKNFDITSGLVDSFVTNSYLWDNIRIKGGAYGAYLLSGSYSNAVVAQSYDDPNIFNTIVTFKNISKYLKECEISEEELNKLKITMLSIKPEEAKEKGRNAITSFLNDTTYEEKCQNRKKVINLTLDDLKTVYDIYDEAFKDDALCVLGSKDSIQKNKKLFKEIKTL